MSNIVDLSQINNFKKYSEFIQQIRVIGRGTFGKVYKATVNNILPIGPIAVKIIELDKKRWQDQIKGLEEENNFLMPINHPNIMKVYFHFARIDNQCNERQYYIGMEYAPNDLESILNQNFNFSPDEITKLAQQLQNGLNYLQSLNVAHRDLKPANILKSEDGTYKLCDFSETKFSKDTINTVTQTLHGTANYLDPKLYKVYLQIVEDKKFNRPVNFDVNYNPIKADVFSFGLIILQCLMGYSEDQIMGVNQSEEGTKYLINNNFTDAYKWFLKLCLNYDEKQRWSFEKMNKIFKLNLIEAAYYLEVKDIQLVERDNQITQLKNEIIEIKKENKQLKESNLVIDEYAKRIQSQQMELLKLQKDLKQKEEELTNITSLKLIQKKSWILKKLELNDDEIIQLCLENQKLWQNDSQVQRTSSVKKNSTLTWTYQYNAYDYYYYYYVMIWDYDDDYQYKTCYFHSKYNDKPTNSFIDQDLPKAFELLQKLIKESGHPFKNCLKILHSNLWSYDKSLSQLTEKIYN